MWTRVLKATGKPMQALKATGKPMQLIVKALKINLSEFHQIVADSLYCIGSK